MSDLIPLDEGELNCVGVVCLIHRDPEELVLRKLGLLQEPILRPTNGDQEIFKHLGWCWWIDGADADGDFVLRIPKFLTDEKTEILVADFEAASGIKHVAPDKLVQFVE